uniref:Uncharacterized protein n=1 Tax=Acidianus brierleyi TaxID=41673 RepID=A0A2U9IBF3_9CREN
MILDASIFSRALVSMDVSSLKKYMDEKEHEIVLGRATSMDGSVLKFLRPKIVTSKKRLDDGSILKFESRSENFSIITAASGATFEELINVLEKEDYYPAVFPLYPRGVLAVLLQLMALDSVVISLDFQNLRKISMKILKKTLDLL